MYSFSAPFLWGDEPLSWSRETMDIDPNSDIAIYSPNFYFSLYSSGLLGLGESYMRGEWEEKEKSLDELSAIACSSDIQRKILSASWKTKFSFLANWVQAKLTFSPDSSLVASVHYDLGNDLYKSFLGETMNYSCALFSRQGMEVPDLDSAQERKMGLIAEKLQLEEGMEVLDIGCGFGSLASYLARNYRVKVTGVTISLEQYAYLKKVEKEDERECGYRATNFLFCDYRELPEKRYDAIVSVGMFEHVNSSSYNEFMEKVSKLLLPGGVCLLHTIANIKATSLPNPWIAKYIFPNSSLPSLKEICASSEPHFVIEDVENLSTNYDKTLLAWYENFNKNFSTLNQERRIKGKEELSETFFRMWKYYLLTCAGSFRARKLQVYQVVLSKEPKKAYRRI